MITSQNVNNKQEYLILFDKATEDLRAAGKLGQEDTITTLEEYFCNLKHLYGINDRYIMLPLDEEPFDIDADKRTITIPANFRQNGISVQGDEIAETLFFRIDRFFDAMDFDTCDIFVQWEGVDKIPHVTPVTMKDLESEPGKIIFAWPLSSTLTKSAGNVRFSVRFVKQVAETIVYSFSTLTATATINAALNYPLWGVDATQRDDPDYLFGLAIENSETVAGIPAAEPVFVFNLPSNEELYLITQDDGTHSYTLSVSAGVSDTGEIRYEWYHAKKGSLGPGVDRYTLTADASPVSNKTYYKKENEATYSLYNTNNGFVEEIPAYERYNDFVISGTAPVPVGDANSISGEYFARAINRFGTKEKHSDSNVVKFPSATKPEITKDLSSDGIIGEASGTLTIEYTANENGNTTFEWASALTEDGQFAMIDNATTNTYTPSTPGYYKVSVTSEVNLDTASETSSVVKVTNAPEAVRFVSADQVDAPVASISINRYEEIVPGIEFIPGSNTSELPLEFQTDEIYYTWYQDLDPTGVLDENGNILEGNSVYFGPSASPNLPLTEGAVGMNLRCIATNKLNNKEAHSSSKRYYISNEPVE